MRDKLKRFWKWLNAPDKKYTAFVEEVKSMSDEELKIKAIACLAVPFGSWKARVLADELWDRSNKISK